MLGATKDTIIWIISHKPNWPALDDKIIQASPCNILVAPICYAIETTLWLEYINPYDEDSNRYQQMEKELFTIVEKRAKRTGMRMGNEVYTFLYLKPEIRPLRDQSLDYYANQERPKFNGYFKLLLFFFRICSSFPNCYSSTIIVSWSYTFS